MKKTILLAFVAAVLAVGCASTGTSTSTTATKTMTLDEALQKSAETRQTVLPKRQNGGRGSQRLQNRGGRGQGEITAKG